jgi:integrase/recombinase XerD
MEDSIDSFIRFLAVERGLSENYQLSNQKSLSDFARWCAASKKIDNPRAVTLPIISEYLANRKRAGLSASSIKLIVVALKIFFRFLAAKGTVERDPAEALALPRIERYLTETLN